MEKKVSEKEKMQEKLNQRATKMVEKLVAEGMLLTHARNMARAKFGIGNESIIKLTMHLSPRANKEEAVVD